MTSSIIEHVARAIMLARTDHPGCAVKDWTSEARDNPHVEQAVNQARAAVLAMLDRMETPSEGMLEAGLRDAPYLLEEDFPRVWSAMLSAFREEIAKEGVSQAVQTEGGEG